MKRHTLLLSRRLLDFAYGFILSVELIGNGLRFAFLTSAAKKQMTEEDAAAIQKDVFDKLTRRHKFFRGKEFRVHRGILTSQIPQVLAAFAAKRIAASKCKTTADCG